MTAAKIHILGGYGRVGHELVSIHFGICENVNLLEVLTYEGRPSQD